MNNYYTSRELNILDGYVEKIIGDIIAEDFRAVKGSNWPQVFPDYVEAAYKIAELMLAKRRYYSEKNPYMKHANGE